MTAQRTAVKKYIVTLNDEEREQLNALIHKGKHRAGQLVRARILLKADTWEAGEGWSDSQIALALDTSIATVARTRQQLVEQGFDAVLTRKHSPASARQRIFDGAAEAKLIALACSDPPKGRVRWTLTLLETAVVELNIVDRASDNTIGRTLKKTFSSRTCKSSGSSRPTPTPPSWPAWKMYWKSTRGRATQMPPWSAWTNHRSNSSPKRACRSRPSQDARPGMTMSTTAMAQPTCP